ncbi:Cortical protein marker for cell polarity [Rhizoctonia solani]|uniref:Cortical protein marker for cell polarity n=1 Tax=Rhizoctonia solani TaxID=456999 RepID=A0A8H7H5Q4_9AGAM|nr:Cortical protein marker for cell polarity [Rhizoctonia solani]
MASPRAMSSYPLLSVIFGAAIVGAQNVPQIDFSRMGTVGIAGAFAGLDLYNASAPTLDSSAATLVSRNSDGALTILGGTNGGGQLLSSCSLKDTLYVGGVFDSVAGISARNVIAYTPSSGKFSPLGSDGAGVDGEVNALHCDSSSGLVWVGGNFRRPTPASESSGFGGAVAVFNPSDNTWSPAPFDGFRGQVLDIAPSTDGKSLYFGGSFATTFGSNSTLNATNNPAVPYSPGATPFSASLVPIPLNGSEITAQPASSDSNFNNILDILCPAGNDGPGNTWLGADGSTASITARPFKFINAGGIRLGNTAINGRSTTAFTLTTIPDNNVLELTYNDPATNQTRTCTDSCPLAPSSAALYQDFLFTTSQQITGFQLRLTQWSGSGPGLHILQLLSNGAFANALQSLNSASCYAPDASDTSTAGTWVTTETATSIPGTTQNILVATVPVGTSSANSPSITWNSYVSGSGEYEVYLMIPGCTRLQDCDARTSVKVTVSPGGAIAPASTTISQRVSDDTQALVYRGPVIPSTPDYRSTVTLQLADNPEGSGQGGQYHLVADRVQFVLTSVGTSGNGTGNSTAPGSGRNGFGFFEWPLSASATNATGILPNTTITPFDALAFTIPNATASIHAIAPYSASRLFAGGNFTTASVGSNIVSVDGSGLGAVSGLAANGLNGAVSTLAVYGNILFVGGAFTDTRTGGASNLRYVAQYNVDSNTWASLGNGLAFPVSSLEISNGHLLVGGEFGLSRWDIANGVWVSSGGYVSGSTTFVSNSSAVGGDGTVLGGSFSAIRKYGADGWAVLENGPTVKPLGALLDHTTAASTTPSTASTTANNAKVRRNWFSHMTISDLFTRQQTSNTLPAPPSAPAPAVLAGTFYSNQSISQLTILGGNFTFANGQAKNLAFYDTDTNKLTGVQGTQVEGVVRALYVKGDELFVGGQFTLQGNEGSGLATYGLASGAWESNENVGLTTASGSTVVVRSITGRPSNDDTVIVAGSFASAGKLTCEAVCQWSIQNKQWSTLGSGIRGDVSSVAYAGSNAELLVVAGALTLADGTPANVAMYSFDNSTWIAVGGTNGVPGPVTAIGVDNLNSSSIFAAGRASDGSAPFLTHWDGQQWNALSTDFASSTEVTQLAMVPLSDPHNGNGVLQNNRVLFMSGSLASNSFGSASTALFDGATVYPYISTTSTSGSTGFVNGLFYSVSNFSFELRKFLPRGVVILISIAIAAGIVFLLLLIGVLWPIFSRRDDQPQEEYVYQEADDESLLHRPSSLLEHINAATRNTIVGSVAGGIFPGGEKAVTPDPTDGTHMGEDEDGMGAGQVYNDPDGEGRFALARYSFVPSGDGELALEEGTQVVVLDDRDPAWWFVRNEANGQEGVVPASYLS